ncbi:MAG: 2-amino-4-hydroxy-6-hydroxymethyldihydropteridine diphosphokinase [Acidobacteriota bacterium]|nr:2-amino-4-hydroxy-6-hydroxymethyldihydropteridine diphosphokinase [Acidobacteriota bacterium]
MSAGRGCQTGRVREAGAWKAGWSSPWDRTWGTGSSGWAGPDGNCGAEGGPGPWLRGFTRVPPRAVLPGRGPTLNQVLAGPSGRCPLAPRELLDLGLAIERRCGRRRRRRWEARVLDIDLLVYGPLEVDEPGLVLPHPRMTARRFVLAPLAEILPHLELPPTSATVAERLAALAPCSAPDSPRRIDIPAGGSPEPAPAGPGDPSEERTG